MKFATRKSYQYTTVGCAHILLCMVGFLVFRIHPLGTVFCDYGDGLKNLFTLISYVKEPIGADGLFKYNSFCYPFGDYVYFTDNMPLFSIPFRFFCHFIYDLSAFTIPIFNLFVISNIVVCGLLVFAVFSRLLKEGMFSITMAVLLPWTNMAILRIVRGHYSLSFTSLILFAFYLLLLYHHYGGDRRRQAYVGLSMCLLSFFSFLAHGYMFAIVTMFVAFALLFYAIITSRKGNALFNFSFTAAYTVGAAGLVLAIAGMTDKYLSLRQDNAMGYDWMEQKVWFSGLFTHYRFNKIYFPCSSFAITNDAEKAAYLGNVGLFLMAGIVIAAIFSRQNRQSIASIHREYIIDPVRVSILLSGFVLLFVSFGEIYNTSYPADTGLKLTNVFNPFFYLHFFTKKIEQFRSLERFIYPFYFSFYVWTTFMLVRVYERSSQAWKVVLLVAVLFLGGSELKDNVDRMQAGTDVENPFDKYNLDNMKVPGLDYHKYQAILPIPYYCTGSENYDYTIDVDGPWFMYTQKLGLKTSLPLMSYVLSRVPPAHNIALVNCVANGLMDDGLKKLFTDKPVLVAVNKKLIADGNVPSEQSNPNGAALYKKSCTFAARNNLAAIDSVGDVVFYEWMPRS